MRWISSTVRKSKHYSARFLTASWLGMMSHSNDHLPCKGGTRYRKCQRVIAVSKIFLGYIHSTTGQSCVVHDAVHHTATNARYGRAMQSRDSKRHTLVIFCSHWLVSQKRRAPPFDWLRWLPCRLRGTVIQVTCRRSGWLFAVSRKTTQMTEALKR